jgi:geranylgeranyl diphosphate synthase, type II
MTPTLFKEYLAEKKKIIDAALDRLLPGDGDCPRSLARAMRYSTMAGGKRLRPILCLAACRAVGGEETVALSSACALEMIHTYSLIHDDLPAMDDDDLRRGHPTLHRVFPEGTAILAGDGLLTLAFEVVAGDNGLTDHQARLIMQELASGSGYSGMVGGQQADLDGEGQDISLEALEYIHAHKTGALLTASVICGTIAGDGSKEEIELLRQYGRRIGLAFQIKDDLLDIESESSILGKTIGQDVKSGKATYPSLWGIESSRKKLDQAVASSITALEAWGAEADPLRQIARYISVREK